MINGALRKRIALGAGVALAAVLALVAAILFAPPQPPNTAIERLEEAVGLGLLDQSVLDELRATGEAEATVHLDARRILAGIAGVFGPDRVQEGIGRMRTAFADHKAAIRDALAPSIEIVRDFEYLGAFVVRIRSESALLLLLRAPGVRSVGGEDVAAAPEPVIQAVGSRPRPGSPLFQGAGVAVGVLDTGLDTRLAPELFPQGSIAGSFDVGPDDGALDDNPWSHGSHVASTVLLVAPQATVYAADVFEWIDYRGERRHSGRHYPDGVNRMIGLVEAGVNLRAINLSLGGGHYAAGQCSDVDDTRHFYEAYTVAGIIPVASAGNSAFEDDDGNPTVAYQPGMGHPACLPYVLSVGAVRNGGCGPGDPVDVVWEDSQSNDDLGLLAPGVCIDAAGGVLSGTSMAAPHVSAAVAILAGAKPGATNDEIRAALVGSGPAITDPNSGITRRRLDVPAALGVLLAGSVPAPTVRTRPGQAVRLGPGPLAAAAPIAAGENVDLDRFGVRNVGADAGLFSLEIAAPDLDLVAVAPASWFTLTPSLVALDPDEHAFVTPTVRVPPEAPPGDYAALIVARDTLSGTSLGSDPELTAVRVTFTVAAPTRSPGFAATLADLLLGPVGLAILALAIAAWWLRGRGRRTA